MSGCRAFENLIKLYHSICNLILYIPSNFYLERINIDGFSYPPEMGGCGGFEQKKK